MHAVGVPEALIQKHGRWRSDGTRRYLQFAGALAYQPTALLAAAQGVVREGPVMSKAKSAPQTHSRAAAGAGAGRHQQKRKTTRNSGRDLDGDDTSSSE